MNPIFLVGFLFGFCFIVRGVWFVATLRAAKGFKCLAIGLLPPVALVILAMLLFPSCAENDPGLSEWVSLRGKVVNSGGHPVEGVNMRFYPRFMARDDDYGRWQTREAVTDASGAYELTEVKPLSLEMTAGYLVNSNAFVRGVPFFFGEIYANPSFDKGDTEPQLILPVISENRLKRARLSIRFLGWPGRKEKGVWLPRSEGDVIFLPDIIIGDDPSVEENKRLREKSLQEMRKTAVRFGPNGYWDDKGTYRPYP